MIDHPEDYADAGPTEPRGDVPSCGRGCNCVTQCGDYYDASGFPKPFRWRPAGGWSDSGPVEGA